jgi:hypothetical protein
VRCFRGEQVPSHKAETQTRKVVSVRDMTAGMPTPVYEYLTDTYGSVEVISTVDECPEALRQILLDDPTLKYGGVHFTEDGDQLHHITSYPTFMRGDGQAVVVLPSVVSLLMVAHTIRPEEN